jgi:hypothetical protein
LHWPLDVPKNWIQESRGGVVGFARGPGGHRTTTLGIPEADGNGTADDAAGGADEESSSPDDNQTAAAARRLTRRAGGKRFRAAERADRGGRGEHFENFKTYSGSSSSGPTLTGGKSTIARIEGLLGVCVCYSEFVGARQ